MAKSNKVSVTQIEVDESALSEIPLSSSCVQWDACDKYTGEAVTVLYNLLDGKVTYLGADGNEYCGAADNLTSEIVDASISNACVPTYAELYEADHPEWFA